jgi:hypothetical protein
MCDKEVKCGVALTGVGGLPASNSIEDYTTKDSTKDSTRARVRRSNVRMCCRQYGVVSVGVWCVVWGSAVRCAVLSCGVVR